MKLTKREAGFIRNVAFFNNVLEQKVERQLSKVLSNIPEKKHALALGYYQYLTTNDGKKSYVVDFKANGAGCLTFHDCTAEEAVEKTLFKLQNGAFGKSEKLEDISIQKVSPDTIHYNQYDDYLKWESQLEQLA